MFKKMWKVLLLVLFCEFVNVQPAHAYLDPGIGSYMLQILIAGVLGFFFYAKSIIRRVKNFLDRLRGKNNI
jgi:hypothetical protein